MRVTGCGVVPIVLVVVLVLVIEKAEYVRMIRWGVEDEDEYESPAGYGHRAERMGHGAQDWAI